MASTERNGRPAAVQRPVVVGVDGSESARFAAEWAADVAAAHRCPLHLVHVVPGDPGEDAPPWPVWLRETVAAAERVGADASIDGAPGSGTVRDDIDRYLLRRAEEARLVVVGSHGAGARAGMLAGDLALLLVSAAPCPVAVVRGPAPHLAPPRSGPVVVGSGSDQGALLVAAELAAAAGAPLRIVRAVTDVSDSTGSPHRLLDGWPALMGRAGADLRADADLVTERFPSVPVRTDVVAGTALQVLLDASRSARAVVVGRRVRPPSGEMVLGSTGRGLTGFAACPVVVVPPTAAGPVAGRQAGVRRSTVSDVMTTEVEWMRPDASFSDIAAVLRRARIRAVPVLDPDRRLLGVVSEADLLATLAQGERITGPQPRPRHVRRAAVTSKAGARDAAALMTPAPVTAAPDDPVAAAARRMRDSGVAWMPVVAGDRVVGVLGRSDLLAVFHRSDDEVRAEIVEEVFRRILLLEPSRVRVEVRGGVVTLEGELDTPADVDVAVRFSERVEGVVAVVDRLRCRTDGRTAGPARVRRS